MIKNYAMIEGTFISAKKESFQRDGQKKIEFGQVQIEVGLDILYLSCGVDFLKEFNGLNSGTGIYLKTSLKNKNGVTLGRVIEVIEVG